MIQRREWLFTFGHLPRTKAGKMYIVIVCDYFTRWTEGVSVTNIEASTVAQTFVFQFICRFAVPRQVHTDHVTQFESDLLKEIYKLLGIDKTKTTPYYPRSDGLVERFNRTLKCMLNKYIENTQKTGIYNYPY